MRFLTIAVVGAAVLFSAAAAQAADAVTLRDCFLSPENEVLVPAQEAGVLVQLPVRDGQEVKKGQLLAQIDDIIPRAQFNIAQYKLKVAEKQAADDVEVRYAVAAYNFATGKLNRSVKANERTPNTRTLEEIEEQRLEQQKSKLMIEKSQKDLDVAVLQKAVSEAELNAAEANLKHRRIVSPLDAMVVEVKCHEGEWMQEGNTVMRLVGVDVLRVEGTLNVAEHRPADIQNRPVSVAVTLAGGQRETFPGKIVYVNPMIRSDGAFQVRAEVQNRQQNGVWILSPGMSAEMTIQLR